MFPFVTLNYLSSESLPCSMCLNENFTTVVCSTGRVTNTLVSWQVTSTMESLFRHCYCYKDQTSPYLGTTTCVRLNNLSISRIGSVERLLWVQVLDLSHNELRSTEGILFYLAYTISGTNCCCTFLRYLWSLYAIKFIEKFIRVI